MGTRRAQRTCPGGQLDQSGRPTPRSSTAPDSRGADRDGLRRRRLVAWLAAAAGIAEVVVLATSPPLVAALLPVAGLLFLFARRGTRSAQGSPPKLSAPAVKALPPSLADEGTGLPNRRYLVDELAREMGRSARHSYSLTLAVVEVARLAELESALGPAVARQAAQQVAATLRRVTRASDFLARLDDSRFAVCLTRCTREQSDRFSERVALAVANRPVPADGLRPGPVNLAVTVAAVEFDRERFTGPVRFLRAALGDSGGDTARGTRSRGVDVRDLRRQLVRGYGPQVGGHGTTWADQPLAGAR